MFISSYKKTDLNFFKNFHDKKNHILTDHQFKDCDQVLKITELLAPSMPDRGGVIQILTSNASQE